MSEVKSEVEYVIKTGRQVVDKKQVDFPEKLSAQLDAIKLQYNEMGVQVRKKHTIIQDHKQQYNEMGVQVRKTTQLYKITNYSIMRWVYRWEKSNNYTRSQTKSIMTFNEMGVQVRKITQLYKITNYSIMRWAYR